jgi:hypothetical protein
MGAIIKLFRTQPPSTEVLFPAVRHPNENEVDASELNENPLQTWLNFSGSRLTDLRRAAPVLELENQHGESLKFQ